METTLLATPIARTLLWRVPAVQLLGSELCGWLEGKIPVSHRSTSIRCPHKDLHQHGLLHGVEGDQVVQGGADRVRGTQQPGVPAWVSSGLAPVSGQRFATPPLQPDPELCRRPPALCILYQLSCIK